MNICVIVYCLCRGQFFVVENTISIERNNLKPSYSEQETCVSRHIMQPNISSIPIFCVYLFVWP